MPCLGCDCTPLADPLTFGEAGSLGFFCQFFHVEDSIRKVSEADYWPFLRLQRLLWSSMVLPWDRLKWSENPTRRRMSMVNVVKYMGGIYKKNRRMRLSCWMFFGKRYVEFVWFWSVFFPVAVDWTLFVCYLDVAEGKHSHNSKAAIILKVCWVFYSRVWFVLRQNKL